MIFLMDENTMTVGEILEFIKEKDIDKGNKVLYDPGDGPHIITTFGRYDEIITFTGEYKNCNADDSLTVASFLEHVKGVDLNTTIAYLETDYITLDTCFTDKDNRKKESALLGIEYVYREEDTHNLVFSSNSY